VSSIHKHQESFKGINADEIISPHLSYLNEGICMLFLVVVLVLFLVLGRR